MGSPVMACAVCGGVLDTLVDRNTNEAVGHMHTQEYLGFETDRHVVVPVPIEDLPNVVLKCDFCYRTTTRAEGWSLPAHDFELPEGAGDSVGAWIACVGCFRLINLDWWNKLVVRAAIGAAEEHERLGQPVPPAAALEHFLTATFERLRENRAGSLTPLWVED